jgi:hypothetical protein
MRAVASPVVSRVWTDRHEIGTTPSQTRAPRGGIVSLEGGGTVIPTLGGGMGFCGHRRFLAVRAARAGAE